MRDRAVGAPDTFHVLWGFPVTGSMLTEGGRFNSAWPNLDVVGMFFDRRLSKGDARPGEWTGGHYHKSITCSGEQRSTTTILQQFSSGHANVLIPALT